MSGDELHADEHLHFWQCDENLIRVKYHIRTFLYNLFNVTELT